MDSGQDPLTQRDLSVVAGPLAKVLRLHSSSEETEISYHLGFAATLGNPTMEWSCVSFEGAASACINQLSTLFLQRHCSG